MIGAALDLLVVGRDPAAVEALSTELGQCPEVAVVGTGHDVASILRMVERRDPRIIVVAVNTELACRLITEIRAEASLPIVAVCTDSRLGMRALSCGALEWVEGHRGREKILESIRLMASIRTIRHARKRAAPPPEEEPTSGRRRPDYPRPSGPLRPEVTGQSLPRVVAIGGSTGAPVALLELLGALASPVPAPVIIAQHMPHDYSEAFAHWLANTTGRQVKLAQAGHPLERGMIHVAPANHHTTLLPEGIFRLERAQGTGAAPSIDRLFRSLTGLTGMQRFAVLLTGMGRDGADGLLALRQSGARTLAQDEKSCAVFGMPLAAAELGAAEALLSPAEIGLTLAEWLLPPLNFET
ncbi:MAG: chemotaxis protein CheB [Deltaproteobacteria bacterium]|nr:chemotaxis protein CheB [Deltaproteobacteria bacterium]